MKTVEETREEIKRIQAKVLLNIKLTSEECALFVLYHNLGEQDQ